MSPPSTLARVIRGALVALVIVAGFVWPRAAAGAGTDRRCPSGNVLAQASLVHWLDAEHRAELLTDGTVVPEGAYFPSQAVLFATNAGSLTFDLGSEITLRGAFLQADAADAFALQTSLDRSTWRAWTFQPMVGVGGMRSRSVKLDDVVARFVRFGEPVGDGTHAATELQLYCTPPAGPPALRVLTSDPEPGSLLSGDLGEQIWLATTGAPWLTEAQSAALKLVLTLYTLALLGLGALATRARRPLSPPAGRPPWYRHKRFVTAVFVTAPVCLAAAAVSMPHGGALSSTATVAAVASAALVVACLALAARPFVSDERASPSRLRRVRDGLLVMVGVAGAAAYFNFGAFHYPEYIHNHDFFHYYVGSKYFRELGYSRLYECTSAAEAEQGFRRRVELRKARDLRSNAIVDGSAILANGRDCKKSFVPERWTELKRDTAYFRDHLGVRRWQKVFVDHGYNPSPVWTMIGGGLAGASTASADSVGSGLSIGGGGLLGLLDPVLLLATCLAIVWAFGWRTACVALVFLGCNPLAAFAWTGGSLLRQDWLFATVLAICLLEKRRHVLGGASAGAAALLRIFPATLLAALALGALVKAWRGRALPAWAWRFAAGALLAAAVLVPLSARATGGFQSWRAFAQNLQKHASTPTMNLVGLKTALSFRPSTRAEVLFDPTLEDPHSAVREARRANFARARPVFVIALLVLGALAARAAARLRHPWMLAALGAAWVPILTEPSCYYTSVLVLLALFARERDDVPLGLLGFAAAAQILELVATEDTKYAMTSWALVALCAFTLWACGRPAAPRPS